LLLCYSGGSFAQIEQNINKHLSTKNGLVNDVVSSLYQDHDGYIWIGTQAGLQRYDGTRFKTYLADVRDTNALQTDWISAIFEDSKHRLWIGTDHGAPYILDRASGKFYNFNLSVPAKYKVNGTWRILEDHKGNIWIAGHEGYYKLDEKNRRFVKRNKNMGLKDDLVTGSMAIDREDKLWLCTVNGLVCYDPKNRKLYSKNYNPQQNPLFEINASIESVLIDHDNIWITTNLRYLYRYDLRSNKLNNYHFKKKIGNIFESMTDNEQPQLLSSKANGDIIIGLPGRGLATYHADRDVFTIEEIDNTTEYALHVHSIYSSFCMLETSDHSVMIGSDGGINISNKEKQIFYPHQIQIGTGNQVKSGRVSDFLELPDGNILISYYEQSGGVIKTNHLFNYQNHYLAENAIKKGTDQIWSLFQRDDSTVWAPNQEKSILNLNLKNNRIREDKNLSQNSIVTTIQKGTQGEIWMGLWSKGLGLVNIDNKTVKQFNSFLNPEMSRYRRVQSILVDFGKIWVGTFQNGLQIFDIQKEKFTSAYKVNERDTRSISSNTILDIIRYNQDTLILATEMGVNIFDTKKNIFTAITTKDGLPNNLVLGLMKDENGDIWALCSGAICRINIHHFGITSYDINDGIIDNVFSGRIYQLKSGIGLIATSNGFISFDPSEIAASLPPSKPRITGFKVFEKERMVDSLISKGKPIYLSYSENSIKIEFASLDLWEASRVKYYYMLEGVDEDWVKAGKNQSATYNQLTNGKYIFKVKSANRDNVFSEEITEFQIVIFPPFWKTWWFIFLILILVIVIAYSLLKARERNLRAIDKEKIKVEQLNAIQYKSELELEQIVNYFTTSLVDKNTVDDVLWDVANNLISRLDFTDCMLYLWNEDKTKMVQRASYGSKDSAERIEENKFDVISGQGLVGYVIQTKQPIVVSDTSLDARYREDDQRRFSEITVPILYNGELMGVIDSEHAEKNFFSSQHMQILNTIATLIANKINSIRAENTLQHNKIEIHRMNEQLSNARLEALRSQMNPHFIFNSLNAIQECILTNNVDAAYEYLSKFSKLQRMVLNNSSKEFITLSSELEMLRLYLSLESLRFSQSFTYNIDVDNIDTNEVYLASMLIQPYVENAIWHGLRNKQGEKMISIFCKEEDGKLKIIIDDNGIGRQKAAMIKAQKIGYQQHESKGTVLTEERMKLLSLKYQAAVYVEIIDKMNENDEPSGTTITIILPINFEPNNM